MLQNKAIRSILGAFKTTPLAALEAEAAIPPTEIRLFQLKRRYSMKLISAPEFHPLRRRCPDDYPPYYDTGPNQEDEYTCPWYLPTDNPPPNFRIDKILNLMTRWIMPNHDLETISYIHDKPWRSTTTQTEISASPKDIAVQQHIQLLRTIINPSGYVYAYTDGSKLDNGQTGAGAVIYQYNKSGIQISYSMGDECELYDAEFNALALCYTRINYIRKYYTQLLTKLQCCKRVTHEVT
jgi:hypothetical protein